MCVCDIDSAYRLLAKLQLKERLSHSKALSERIIGIETTDKLTDPQIVAKVKDHYGIDPSLIASQPPGRPEPGVSSSSSLTSTRNRPRR